MEHNHNWLHLAHIIEYNRVREHEEMENENDKLKILMSIVAGKRL